jgi:hypothetical protein
MDGWALPPTVLSYYFVCAITHQPKFELEKHQECSEAILSEFRRITSVKKSLDK